jgi:hypothetical protein
LSLKESKYQQAVENCITTSFTIYIFLPNRVTKSKQAGDVCGTYGGERKRMQDFGWKSWRKENA